VNLRNQLVRNVLTNWAFLLLNLAIFFFLSPYIIDVLGPSRAGIWFLLGSITGYFGLVGFGIPAATEKYVAEYLARNEREQVNRIVASSLFLSIYAALIAVVAAAVLCFFVDKVFKIADAYLVEARQVMVVIGLDLALAYPCGLMFNVLKGFNRYDVRSAILIPALLVRAAGLYLVLRLGAGVVAMVLIQLAINLLSYLAATLWVFRHAPWIRANLRFRDRGIYRLLLVYGAFQFIALAADVVITYTDLIIIGSLVAMGGVTVYNIAAQLRTLPRNISAGLDGTLRPAASHLHTLGDTAGLQRLLVLGGRIILVMLGGLYVLYATWGDRFVSLWQYGLTREAVYQVYYCLMILIAPTFLTVVLGPGIAIIYGMAKHRPHAVLGAVVMVANIGLSIWLANVIGIYGVAVGTVVPLFFIRGLYMYYYVPHTVGMGMGRFIASVWGRPLLGLVPLAAVLTALRFVIDFDRLLWIVLFFVAAGAAYMLWVYTVVLTREEKALARDVIAGRPFGLARGGPKA